MPFVVVVGLMVVPESTVATAGIPAFPGAAGFGASTPGGRGGKVLFVTNTNDDGPGSLRVACETEGPRIVVFRIGGTIVLESDLLVKHPNLTIAGQTAPGGGVCLRNARSNKRAALTITANDVVIRYLRIRPGLANKPSCCLRGIAVVKGAHHIVVDHCSLSWSVDELFTVWDRVHDVTLQWCFLTEAIHRGNHKDGPHSCGTLLGDKTSRNFSLHHNLYAHNDQRNPRIKCGGVVDVVNNVVYNYGGTSRSSWGASHVSHGGRVNYVGNYVKTGSNSVVRSHWISADGQAAFYVNDNITSQRKAGDQDQYTGVVRNKDHFRIVAKRFDAPLVPAVSPREAVRQVLESAGASAKLNADAEWAACRDPVDLRIVRDLRAGRGRIIDDPQDVGGWPRLEAGKPPVDTDFDGMPDRWEQRYDFDPRNPEDGVRDSDGDGYTNVEEFLNASNPRNQ